jgi:NAD(P)H dehydrogenase (quinone)
MFLTRRSSMIALALAASVCFAADKNDEESDKIVISGASGGLAGETISALLGNGVHMEQLILVTRTPEKLSAFADRGATVRAGDFNKPDSLPAAFEGGRQLLLISTNGGGDRVAQHTAAINAARRVGIKHIVYTSWINAVEDNPAVVTRDHRLTEEALKKSGVPYTILRNQVYADGLVAQGARAVANGLIVTNSGRGMWAPVARKDCAAAAAAVLATSGHEGRTYDITGPDLITERDFAQMLTDITKKPVRVVNVDDNAYIESLVKSGMPEAGAKAAASFGVATRTNYLNIKSETLELLLGRHPESVRQLLAENKSRLLAPPSPDSAGR